LELNITREGVLMRCAEHGIQFRYVVDCEQASEQEKNAGAKNEYGK
jgi:hypothetical protein